MKLLILNGSRKMPALINRKKMQKCIELRVAHFEVRPNRVSRWAGQPRLPNQCYQFGRHSGSSLWSSESLHSETESPSSRPSAAQSISVRSASAYQLRAGEITTSELTFLRVSVSEFVCTQKSSAFFRSECRCASVLACICSAGTSPCAVCLAATVRRSSAAYRCSTCPSI